MGRALGVLLALWVAAAATHVHGQPQAKAHSRAEVSITVLKSQRLLRLYVGNRPVKVYRIFLGSSPKGPKVKRGDNRTPEGTYRVVEKKVDSKFHRFIGINYPNARDAEIGYKERRLTASQRADVLNANTRGMKPPWNTPLGGSLGIHGIGENEKRKLRLIGDTDWTNGCIALTNSAVDDLFRRVPLGTVVRIDK